MKKTNKEKIKISPPKKPRIIVDNRERMLGRIIRERYECEIEEKQLNIGDFVLSDRVVVERKTGSDFLQSIIDGRLFNQLLVLRDIEKPILLIEGDVDKCLEDAGVNPNAYRGALGSIAIDFGIPILWTKDIQDTAGLLHTIARREQLKKKRPLSIRVKRKFKSLNQQQEFLVAGLPSVSTILARRLLSHFKTPEKVFNASEDELQQVHGIGKEMSRKLRNILEREYDISVLESDKNGNCTGRKKREMVM